MHKIGARVGAIVSANKEEIKMFGYGVYEGDHPLPSNIRGPFGYMEGVRNPKITLDSGEVVWGCECWWGPEDDVKESIKERRVVTVTPDEYRSQVVD